MSTNDPTAKKTDYQANLEGFTLDLARLVGAHLPDNVGFILLCFDYSDAAKARGDGNGFLAYASSATRTTAIAALKEWIERAEAEARADGGAS